MLLEEIRLWSPQELIGSCVIGCIRQTLAAMKDRQQLEKYRSQLRGTAPEQAKISQYLSNSVSTSWIISSFNHGLLYCGRCLIVSKELLSNDKADAEDIT